MLKLQEFMRHPRYLRAIPSLMLLTTAIAWSVSPDLDAQESAVRRSSVATSQTSVALPLGLSRSMEDALKR